MANSSTDFDPIDRLSDLPDALLITIISFLPTPIAVRTSVLCRRFRHLWEASPSLALISYGLPRPGSKDFIAMAKRALIRRNPYHPLHSLYIEICKNAIAIIPSLLAKARSLDLRQLTMEVSYLSDLLPILPIVFTINSLRCLSLRLSSHSRRKLNFPSGINLTNLRSLSLSLKWYAPDLVGLNKLLSELCSLEDLHLVHIRDTSGFSLSSQTIRKLKLIIMYFSLEVDIVELSLPSLESLHLDIRNGLGNLSRTLAKVPLLRKAVIKLGVIREKNVSTIDGLLNCISHVEELSLHLKEREEFVENQIPFCTVFESGKDVPHFHNLKHLDVTLCFHEHNLTAVIMMLHNCPILKSLKLVHEVPEFTLATELWIMEHWASKLPCNSDGNNCYAYYRNLHLEEDCKEFMKLLSKKCTSRKQARN